MSVKKEIQINCRGAEDVSVALLVPFQGALKTLSEENYVKCRDELLRDGFCEPITTWKRDLKPGTEFLILNGHQRVTTIKRMIESEGYASPKLPVSIVYVRDEAQANDLVLALTAQFGEMTNESLANFIRERHLDPKTTLERFPHRDTDADKVLRLCEEPERMPGDSEADANKEFDALEFNSDGEGNSFRITNSDCLEGLRALPSNSVDSLVTDPPAGIAFMGKAWDDDKGGRDQWIAWLADVMRECLRVLKPGAHGLVWALPRTSHWTTTALENAGFEIRDVVMHVFGSGFPKSLDISKAIDKAAGAEREVTGTLPAGTGPLKRGHVSQGGGGGLSVGTERSPELKITAPATPAAKQWNGWGTGLKPAAEHWILIRKPLDGTVAANVLKYGTGGINVDGTRVGNELLAEAEAEAGQARLGTFERGKMITPERVGRFPSHLILSHSEACKDGACVEDCPVKVMDEQSLATKNEDSNGASRFFMVLKYECGQENIKNGDTFVGRKTASNVVNSNTDISGKKITGLFQTDSISITETGTHSIITLQILSVSKLELIGIITIDLEKIIKPSMGSNIESVSVAASGEALINFTHDQTGPIKGIANLAALLTPQIGALKTGSIGTLTTEKEEGKINRFFYIAKPATSEKDAGLTGEVTSQEEVTGRKEGSKGGEHARAGFHGTRRNSHPTVKPVTLMRYLCRMITPPNGVVLDAFTGSGTTAIGALAEQFNFIGFEQDVTHAETARKRVEVTFPKATNLNGVRTAEPLRETEEPSQA